MKADNTVFVELGGNAVVWSVNYERYLTDSLGLRLGFGYYSVAASGGGSSGRASVAMVPLMVDYLLGKAPHKFEMGLGGVLFYASADASMVGSSDKHSGSLLMGTATAGYRYSPYDGGFVFRAGVTPLFGHGFFLPWLGVSFGFGF